MRFYIDRLFVNAIYTTKPKCSKCSKLCTLHNSLLRPPLDIHINWAECRRKLKFDKFAPIPLASYYILPVLGAIFLYIFWIPVHSPGFSSLRANLSSHLSGEVKLNFPCDGCEYVHQRVGSPRSGSFFVLAGPFLAAVGSFFLLAGSHSLPFAPIRPLYLPDLSPCLCLPSAPTLCFICLPSPKNVFYNDHRANRADLT